MLDPSEQVSAAGVPDVGHTPSECAGYRLLDDRAAIRMTGADRISFLHGMCSADIRSLHAGEIVYGLFLTEHAHVIADFYAWALTDAILIEIERALWARARPHLEKLIVADDVEFDELADSALIDIEGAGAPEAVRTLAAGIGGVAVPEPWRYIDAGAMKIANIARVGAPAFTIITACADAAGVIQRLTAKTPSLRELGKDALEALRIENGLARVGVDTSEKTIALEARLEPAISFSKGCYLGQETIERATARGGLKRRLFGLRLDSQRAAERGASVSLDGREVGRVSSAAMSPRSGSIALSILPHSAWTGGTSVRVRDSKGELAAVVSDLPFK